MRRWTKASVTPSFTITVLLATITMPSTRFWRWCRLINITVIKREWSGLVIILVVLIPVFTPSFVKCLIMTVIVTSSFISFLYTYLNCPLHLLHHQTRTRGGAWWHWPRPLIIEGTGILHYVGVRLVGDCLTLSSHGKNASQTYINTEEGVIILHVKGIAAHAHTHVRGSLNLL